ncbi:MAG: lysophospholipid acyltransferase family protein [Bacteroidales bacterium]|nr:lysophospholipid acyltransferase family protein [Bacteroidales bacterium]
MQLIVYIFSKILYGFLWLITKIPLQWLQVFAFILFPFIYYIFPYRKKLVLRNIRTAFPEWTEKKVRKTAKNFYLYFNQSLIESLYTGTFSKKNYEERYKVRNPELCNNIFEKGKSVTLLMAHYGNWEWSQSMQLCLKHQVLPIYKPLHNRVLDQKIKNDREKFGAIAIPMEKILRTLFEFEKHKKRSLTLFVADQRPLMAKIQYWTNFFHQDTPVVMGPEKIAHKFNHAVVFLKIIPIKRGYYEAEFVQMFDNLEGVKEYEIMETYHSHLEKMIREKPEYWLWTHNRWKHKKEDFYRLQKKREGR